MTLLKLKSKIVRTILKKRHLLTCLARHRHALTRQKDMSHSVSHRKHIHRRVRHRKWNHRMYNHRKRRNHCRVRKYFFRYPERRQSSRVKCQTESRRTYNWICRLNNSRKNSREKRPEQQPEKRSELSTGTKMEKQSESATEPHTDTQSPKLISEKTNQNVLISPRPLHHPSPHPRLPKLNQHRVRSFVRTSESQSSFDKSKTQSPKVGKLSDNKQETEIRPKPKSTETEIKPKPKPTTALRNTESKFTNNNKLNSKSPEVRVSTGQGGSEFYPERERCPNTQSGSNSSSPEFPGR